MREYYARIFTPENGDLIEDGHTYEPNFANWLKKASEHANKIGKTCRVSFSHHHSFEINPGSSPHLMTPEVGMIDPALEAQFSGD